MLCCGGVVAAISKGADTADSAGTPAAATSGATSGSATPAEGGTEQKTETKADEPRTYRVGQTVRGGDFEFVVHGVKCGLSQVGDSYLNRKAQGSFCRVDISAKNVTRSAHLFHADGTVTAQDTAGRKYESDGEANIYGNKDGAGFLDEVNPGNSIRAFAYFDVPKGTKLRTITFDAGLLTLAEDAVVTL